MVESPDALESEATEIESQAADEAAKKRAAAGKIREAERELQG